VDSLGELYDCFTARGAEVVGFTSQDDYEHYESKGVRDDQFVGLARGGGRISTDARLDARRGVPDQ